MHRKPWGNNYFREASCFGAPEEELEDAAADALAAGPAFAGAAFAGAAFAGGAFGEAGAAFGAGSAGGAGAEAFAFATLAASAFASSHLVQSFRYTSCLVLKVPEPDPGVAAYLSANSFHSSLVVGMGNFSFARHPLMFFHCVNASLAVLSCAGVLTAKPPLYTFCK